MFLKLQILVFVFVSTVALGGCFDLPGPLSQLIGGLTTKEPLANMVSNLVPAGFDQNKAVSSIPAGLDYVESLSSTVKPKVESSTQQTSTTKSSTTKRVSNNSKSNAGSSFNCSIMELLLALSFNYLFNKF